MKEADRWLELIRDWVILGQNIVIVHYESLLLDKESEIRKILKFLNWDFDETRWECLRATENFTPTITLMRKKSKMCINPFNKRLTAKINHQMKVANELLLRYGHHPLPFNLYKVHNCSANIE